MPRFFKPPAWRFVVTDVESATLTFLDRVCWDATLEIDLNTPVKLSGRVPSANPEVSILHDDGHPFLSEGDRLLYAFRRDGTGGPEADLPWRVRAAGRILRVRDAGLPGEAMTRFEMHDEWAYLHRLPVVDQDGNKPGSEGFNFLNGQAPGGGNWQWGTIALAILKWAIDHYGRVGIDAGDGSRIGEGAEYQDWSGTGVFNGFIAETDETEYQVTRGKTVGEVWSDLCASDKLDIALEPIYDPTNRPGYTSEIHICAEPRVVGQPKMGPRPNAIFSWDKPPRTLSSIERGIDGMQRANQITFYTRYGVVDSFKEDTDSISRYGIYGYEQAFPDMQMATDQVARWAEGQLAIRKSGIREVIPIPNPQQPPLYWFEFEVGDTCPFYASRRLREALPSDDLPDPYHRVFGATFELNRPDFTERLAQLRVSPDGGPPGAEV